MLNEHLDPPQQVFRRNAVFKAKLVEYRAWSAVYRPIMADLVAEVVAADEAVPR
jgi:hypothetical protein